MSNKTEWLAKRMWESGQVCLEYFKSQPPAFWEQTIYTDGACWSTREILAHFWESEKSMRALVEHILAGGAGVPEDFNLNVYNELHVARLDQLGVPELIEGYQQARQENVEFVKQMKDEDLAKSGRHPFLGIAPVEEILKLLYRHNQVHLREIRQRIA